MFAVDHNSHTNITNLQYPVGGGRRAGAREKRGGRQEKRGYEAGFPGRQEPGEIEKKFLNISLHFPIGMRQREGNLTERSRKRE